MSFNKQYFAASIVCILIVALYMVLLATLTFRLVEIWDVPTVPTWHILTLAGLITSLILGIMCVRFNLEGIGFFLIFCCGLLGIMDTGGLTTLVMVVIGYGVSVALSEVLIFLIDKLRRKHPYQNS